MVGFKFFFLDNSNWPQPGPGAGGPTLLSLTGAGGLSFLLLLILESVLR